MGSERRLLRDPVDRAWSLYEERRAELEERGWSLGDVYLKLGGGGPRSSELHARFSEFFNGQTRDVLGAGENQAKLEYWAGIPERGAALRDEALRTLSRDEVAVATDEPRGRPDPETRSLILAHNQIDVELHGYFTGVPERSRPRHRPRATRPSQRSGAICVLGAPRSGTSLTARALNILGVDLGSESELMPPAAANNRTGFWEHEGIVNLNEEILASLSETAPPYLQGWRFPPRLALGWERDPALEQHRDAARSLLSASFAGAGTLWGWKDPRTSVTLPFWQQLVPRMRYVICVRHPLGVAASLAARDRMPVEESLRLWTRYMIDAMASTDGKPRLFVSYENYFPDWEGQIRRLADFLDLAAPSEEQRGALAVHVDESLWHQREAEARTTDLPDECVSLYAELSRLAQT